MEFDTETGRKGCSVHWTCSFSEGLLGRSGDGHLQISHGSVNITPGEVWIGNTASVFPRLGGESLGMPWDDSS